MKIDGRITLLVDKDGARFEIRDADANVEFLRFTMKPEDFCAALGRLAYIHCELDLNHKEVLGKKRLMDKLEFKMPKDVTYKNQKETAYKLAQIVCPEGWEVCDYFNSQDSFYYKDDDKYARATIVKWVEKTNENSK